MLLAQLESVDEVVRKRSKVTSAYQALYSPYVEKGCVTVPLVNQDAKLNHHAFFVIFDTEENQQKYLSMLRKRNVHAYIGYVPLHSSSYGMSLGYSPDDCPVTEDVSKRIVRLPFYTELAEDGLAYCIEMMSDVMRDIYGD